MVAFLFQGPVVSGTKVALKHSIKLILVILSLPKLLEAFQDDIDHIVGGGNRNSEHFGIRCLELSWEMCDGAQQTFSCELNVSNAVMLQ